MMRWVLFTVGVTVLVLLGAAAVVAAANSPDQAVKHYFVATYDNWRAYKDLREETLERSWNHAKIRVVARFEEDPDYGAYSDDTPWYEYANEVEVVRQGMRWVPTRGGFVDEDRTFGVFNAYWVATDPAREAKRAAPALCPCTDYMKATEQLREETKKSQ